MLYRRIKVIGFPKLTLKGAKPVAKSQTNLAVAQDSPRNSQVTASNPQLDQKPVAQSLADDEKIKRALQNAMDQLESFGFNDELENKSALKQAKGDVEKAIQVLKDRASKRAEAIQIYNQQKQAEQRKLGASQNNLAKDLLAGSMDVLAQVQAPNVKPVTTAAPAPVYHPDLDFFSQPVASSWNTAAIQPAAPVPAKNITQKTAPVAPMDPLGDFFSSAPAPSLNAAPLVAKKASPVFGKFSRD